MPGGSCRNKETKITYEGQDGGKDGKGKYQNKVIKVQNCSCSGFRPDTGPDELCHGCHSSMWNDVPKEYHQCEICRCGHSRDMH